MNGKDDLKKTTENNEPKGKKTAFNMKDIKTSLVVIIGLFISMAVVFFGFLVQDNYNASLHSRDVEAARAHTWTRYTALLFEKEKDLSALQGRLPSLVKRFKEADPRIVDIRVLKGTKFLYHADPGKINQRVDPENPDDKQLYDDATQAKFRLKTKKFEDKYLLEPDPENKILTLVEPIVKKRRFAGIVKLRYKYDPDVSTGFWGIFLLGFGLFIIVALACTRVTSKRLQWAIAIPTVLVFMFVGLVIFGNNADTLKINAFNEKATHVENVLTFVAGETPEHLDKYVTALKKGKVKGFFQEWKTAALEPGSTTGTDMAGPYRAELKVTNEKMVVLTADEEHRAAARKEFNRRTRIVTIAFLVIAFLVLIFILAGYAFRTLCAVKKHAYSYIYVFPAMVGMIVLVFFPFVWGTTMGFFKITHTSWDFVGFRNFIDILSDFQPFTPGNFYFTLLVTVMWTVVNVVLHVGIGMILALVLNRPATKMKKMYRVLLILPWAIPNYITALIWKGMFHKQFGAINAFLQVLGVESVSWFNNFWTAFFANVMTNTWLGFPFMMVIALGALQSIPGDLYEAADVDGASKWQQFRHITLPLLKPALFPAIILGTIWTFNMFNIIYLVSNGAPNRSTDILITQAYRFAFENFNWGFAAAYSIIIFAILLAYGTFSNKATKATEGVFD